MLRSCCQSTALRRNELVIVDGISLTLAYVTPFGHITYCNPDCSLMKMTKIFARIEKNHNDKGGFLEQIIAAVRQLFFFFFDSIFVRHGILPPSVRDPPWSMAHGADGEVGGCLGA